MLYYEQLRQRPDMVCIQVREGPETESAGWQNGRKSSNILGHTSIGFEFHLQGSMGFEISLSSNFITPSGQYQYTGTPPFFVALN